MRLVLVVFHGEKTHLVPLMKVWAGRHFPEMFGQAQAGFSKLVYTPSVSKYKTLFDIMVVSKSILYFDIERVFEFAAHSL